LATPRDEPAEPLFVMHDQRTSRKRNQKNDCVHERPARARKRPEHCERRAQIAARSRRACFPLADCRTREPMCEREDAPATMKVDCGEVSDSRFLVERAVTIVTIQFRARRHANSSSGAELRRDQPCKMKRLLYSFNTVIVRPASGTDRPFARPARNAPQKRTWWRAVSVDDRGADRAHRPNC